MAMRENAKLPMIEPKEPSTHAVVTCMRHRGMALRSVGCCQPTRGRCWGVVRDLTVKRCDIRRAALSDSDNKQPYLTS